jgi:antitoxin ParD1/3/4
MPTRDGMLTEAKLAKLLEAARIGFTDIEEGRYRDVADQELEKYLSRLGRQASDRVCRSRE